jgi:hypothetical protein
MVRAIQQSTAGLAIGFPGAAQPPLARNFSVQAGGLSR